MPDTVNSVSTRGSKVHECRIDPHEARLAARMLDTLKRESEGEGAAGEG